MTALTLCSFPIPRFVSLTMGASFPYAAIHS